MIGPPRLDDLPTADRELVNGWLEALQADWHVGRLAEVLAGELPDSEAIRHCLLAELLQLDLRYQWHHADRRRVESYLEAHPELAALDLAPLYQFEAELEAAVTSTPYLPAMPLALSSTPPGQTETPMPQPTIHHRPTLVKHTLLAGKVPLLPEQIDRYRILRRLGEGGMGTVYLAHDPKLDRQVALKVPFFPDDDDGEIVARFRREAQVAATLDHPNICAVHDIGDIDGWPFLVMAYIEGQPLSALMREGKAMPADQAASLVARIARGMEAAHQKQVIHRDLKPSNVLLNLRGEPVIMDFGLARRLNRPTSQLTEVGRLLGTPEYMSPEQVIGDHSVIGPAADIYSLGVILYRMLCGQAPFEGSLGEIIARIMVAPLRPPSSRCPDVDPRLEAICLKAMARLPADRFPSMAAFADALDAYRGGAAAADPVSLPSHRDGPYQAGPDTERQAVRERPPDRTEPLLRPGPVPITMTGAIDGTGPLPPRRGPWGMAVAALVLAAIAGGVGYGVVRLGTVPSIVPSRTEVVASVPSPSPSVAVGPSDAERAAAQLRQGVAALGLKDWLLAIKHLDESLRLAPGKPAALTARGWARQGLGLHPQDREDFTAALAITPSAEAFQGRGLAWLAEKRYREAIDDLRQAIRLDGSQAITHVHLGDALRDSDGLKPALDEYVKAWVVAPEADFVRKAMDEGTQALSESYPRANGKAQQDALAEFTARLQVAPRNPWYFNARGQAHHHLGDLTRALADYDQAIALNPNDGRALRLRGDLYATRRDYPKAQADLDQAIAVQPDDYRARSFRAHLWLALQDEERYRRECQEALARFVGTEDASAANAVVWMCVLRPQSVPDPKAFIELAERSLRREPKNALYLNTLGAACYRAGDLEGAAKSLRAAVELNRKPGLDDRAFLLLLAIRQNQLIEAHEHLKEIESWLKAHPLVQPDIQAVSPSWARRVWMASIKKEADDLMTRPGRP